MNKQRKTTSLLSVIFCMVMCFAITCRVSAATYYLDAATGNNDNPGTSWDEAWETISKCQSTLTSGDTVLIKNGWYGNFYDSPVSTYTDWVTYKAADGEYAVRFGKIYVSHSSPGVNYYHRFEGIVFDKADYPGTPPDYYLWFQRAHYIYLKDCIIRGTGYTRGDGTRGIMLEASNITLDGCTIDGQDSALDCGFEYGIYGGVSYQNVVITNCDIRGCRKCIQPDGKNWTITYNKIHDSYDDGIFVNGNDNSNDQQLLIAYNHIYNHFEKAPDHSDLIQFGQYGSLIKNVIIRGNTCHDSDQQAWWLNPPVGSGPALIENNLVYNTWMAGGAGNDLHISGNLGGNGPIRVRNNIFDVMDMLTSYRAHFDQITGNIIKNFNLDWDGEYTNPSRPITCDFEDYNIIYRWGIYTDSHTPGTHTITINSQEDFEALFNDYDNYDYTPSEDAISVAMVPLDLAPSIDLNEAIRSDTTTAGCYEYFSTVPSCWNSPTQCHGDANGDGWVNTADWPVYREAFMTNYWNHWNDGAGPYNPCADFNRDGYINTGDWPVFRDNWGKSVPEDCNLNSVWPPEE